MLDSRLMIQQYIIYSLYVFKFDYKRCKPFIKYTPKRYAHFFKVLFYGTFLVLLLTLL